MGPPIRPYVDAEQPPGAGGRFRHAGAPGFAPPQEHRQGAGGWAGIVIAESMTLAPWPRVALPAGRK